MRVLCQYHHHSVPLSCTGPETECNTAVLTEQQDASSTCNTPSHTTSNTAPHTTTNTAPNTTNITFSTANTPLDTAQSTLHNTTVSVRTVLTIPPDEDFPIRLSSLFRWLVRWNVDYWGLFQKLSWGVRKHFFVWWGEGVLLTMCPRGGEWRGNLSWGSRHIWSIVGRVN